MILQTPWKFLLICCVLFVQACSTLEYKTKQGFAEEHTFSKNEWKKTQEQLIDNTRWSLMGKIGVRTPSESFTAAINQWDQARDAYVIDLSSTFFGLGATRLLGNEEILTIIEGGEQPISSDNPDLLVAESLGFPLPLNLLTYWVKGIPADTGEYDIQFNEKGLPKQISQAGWNIQISKHQFHNNLPLPHKLKLTNNGTKITLAIKEWTLNPSQTK